MANRQADDLSAMVRGAVGAIAAGIGVIGLTTVAGGAILYVGFQRVGLPAHHALSVIPKSTLLVYGVEALLIWFLGAVAITIVAYVIDQISAPHPEERDRRSANAVEERHPRSANAVEERHRRSAYAVVGLWVAGAVLVGMPLDGPAWVLVGVGAAFYRLIRFVMSSSSRWLPVGLAIFLMSFTIGAGIQLVRTYQAPKVRPGALLRKGEKVGLSGVYIADTDQYVYLGKISPRPRGRGDRGIPYTSRIIAVPRAEVEELAVGKLRRLRLVLRRAETFRKELLKLRAKKVSQPQRRQRRSQRSRSERRTG